MGECGGYAIDIASGADTCVRLLSPVFGLREDVLIWAEYLIFLSSTWRFGPGRIGEVCIYPSAVCGTRADRHEAREGARHIGFLLQNDLTELQTSSVMKYAYVLATIEASIQQLKKAIERQRNGAPDEVEPGGGEEQIILSKQSGKIIAETLDVPALEVEIERAIWQVKRAVKSKRETQSSEAKLEQ